MILFVHSSKVYYNYIVGYYVPIEEYNNLNKEIDLIIENKIMVVKKETNGIIQNCLMDKNEQREENPLCLIQLRHYTIIIMIMFLIIF